MRQPVNCARKADKDSDNNRVTSNAGVCIAGVLHATASASSEMAEVKQDTANASDL